MWYAPMSNEEPREGGDAAPAERAGAPDRKDPEAPREGAARRRGRRGGRGRRPARRGPESGLVEAGAFEDAPPLARTGDPAPDTGAGTPSKEPGPRAPAEGPDGDREGGRARRGRGRRGGRRRREGRAPLGDSAEAASEPPPIGAPEGGGPPPGAEVPAAAGATGRGPERRRERRPKRGRRAREGAERGTEAPAERGRRERPRRAERAERRTAYDRDAIELTPRAPDASAAVEKILLVNATDRDEARIALLVDGRLDEVFIEAPDERSQAGNVYRGRVQNVEKGIGAAFVDLGRGVTGFLHATDLPVKEGDAGDAPVTERLHPGDEVIVQITRDSIGRKGPALTGRISIPGRYLVLMPYSSRSGISRRIPHGRERERVRRLIEQLVVPEGMGVILRTASDTTDLAALKADLDHLVAEWSVIQRKAAEPGQPGVLRGESDIAERSVRDIMPSDVTRIVVDRDDVAGHIHRLLRIWYPSAAAAAEEHAHETVRRAAAAAEAPRGERVEPPAPAPAAPAAPAAPPAGEAPAPAAPAEVPEPSEPDDAAAGGAEPAGPAAAPGSPESPEERMERLAQAARAMPEVELHTDPMPLFHAYNVESQIEDAFKRTIRLPSGGSIVFDQTEALVAIDVNSGRLTDREDPEATALATNLEAVVEVARQLRLRDLGGLVVIDFIDMRERSARREVEKALQEALSRDRARIRLGRMGPFGLVQLSRQRIRQALTRITHEECEACGGTGRRRHLSGLALRVLREIQARVARSKGRGGVEVRAPREVVDWLKRNRSHVLRQLERSATGPITLTVDDRLAGDGWAMRGVPGAGGAPE